MKFLRILTRKTFSYTNPSIKKSLTVILFI